MQVNVIDHFSQKMPTLSENPLQLFGSELERVDCYKYLLGVLLTCDLSWSSHISDICTKARRVYTGPPLQMVLWINLAKLIEAVVSIFGETPPGVYMRAKYGILT